MKKNIKLGLVATISIPLVAIVSCSSSSEPINKIIIGDNADYVEPETKGEKLWKSIEVNLTGITTKSELDSKIKETLMNNDLKKAIGKIVFVKFVRPDGTNWTTKFFVPSDISQSPIAKEFKKIRGTLADYVELVAEGKKPWKNIEVNLKGITAKSELDSKFQEILIKNDLKKAVGKIVFVKFIEPDEKEWVVKFIVSKDMYQSPMAREFKKIRGTLADYIEPAAEGKKPWKRIEVNLTGITTKSELDSKFQETFINLDIENTTGKIVFVKFVKPDGTNWAAKFFVPSDITNSPMGEEFRKIRGTLADYVEPVAKGKKPWKKIEVDLKGITTKSEFEPKFKKAYTDLDAENIEGKVVFVKFIKPDGTEWAIQFIGSQAQNFMGKELEKIRGTLADYIEPAAKGKKPWKRIEVDLKGITTKSEFEPKFEKAYTDLDTKHTNGKAVFVKFIRPNGTEWAIQFIGSQYIDQNLMGKELEKIKKTLVDYIEPAAKDNKS